MFHSSDVYNLWHPEIIPQNIRQVRYDKNFRHGKLTVLGKKQVPKTLYCKNIRLSCQKGKTQQMHAELCSAHAGLRMTFSCKNLDKIPSLEFNYN